MPPLLALAPPGADPGPAALATVALMAAASAGVLLAARRKSPPAVRPLRDRVRASAGTPGSEDDRPRPGHAERRRARRRGGEPTPVRVAGSRGVEPWEAEEGLVVDRSTAGLRLAFDRPLAEGAGVFVRAESAPAGSPWVAVTVRHCQHHGDHYLVGCEYRDANPWGVLLLFE